MNKKIKVFALMAMCAVMAFSLTACGSGSSEGSDDGLTKVTFCLDWTPNTNHTGVYVAQANGYYEEAGLDVEIVQPPEDGAAVMCASGEAQFAVGAQDTMAPALDQEEPLGITAVAGILQHNTSGIISRKGDGIESAKGLSGRTYSTWESPTELAMLKDVVEKDGGDFDSIKLIPNTITDEPAALAANQTDAIWVFEGWGVINADVEKVPVDFWRFSDISEELDYYTPIIIANNDFLENDPETAKAFMEATQKGYEFAIENPDEAADILIAGDNTGSLEGSEELVKKSQEWISKEYAADAEKWGVIDENRWNAFYSWLYENDLTDTDLTGKGFSNNYLPQ
ncbi:MAG: ABC transporter substrate-binding protein [Firmicutes bacterium]|nr:ABC transporter substrate-binding protein [Bacillota bacterium]